MPTDAIDIAELLRAVDDGEPLLLLDLRNDEEFAAWRVEGRRPIDTLHVPYFDFIEDADAAIARLRRDRTIVAVCAKGGSSAMVVDLLRDAGIAARNVEGGMVAYGQHLEATRVSEASEQDGFELWQVNRRGKGCLSYVVRAGAEALVVDPSRDVEWYERFVAYVGARIVRVVDTHVHADHVSGGPALAARNEVPYSVGTDDPGDSGHPLTALGDGESIRLGGEMPIDVVTLATPGHTPGSAAYRVAGRYLLTGDTIFVRGVGRPDLGDKAEEWGRALHRTLHERLGSLPNETVVLPGHYERASEIGADGIVAGRLGALRTLPAFRVRSAEAFVRAITRTTTAVPPEYAEIVRANLGLIAVAPDQATVWELGRNRCAAGR